MMGLRICAAALLSALVIAVTSANEAATRPGLKVGMITTLSGDAAALGIDVRDGFMLAIDRSGVDTVEVVLADDERDADKAIDLAGRMVSDDRVDVMTGLLWSDMMTAVVPSVVAQGTFYLSSNAGPSDFAGETCHRNYFNVAWQNKTLHAAAGAHANIADHDNIFLLAPNYGLGRDALTAFKRRYDGNLAGELYSRLGQRDFTAEIAQIRASGADSVFFFLPGGMGGAFLRQYSDSGVDLPVIGPAFSSDRGVLRDAGVAALGMRSTAQWSPDLDNPANRTFVTAFKNRYGRAPSLYASQGYDTANLLLSAMKKADVTDIAAFRAALLEADFDSVRGGFDFGPNHHPIQDILVREVVRDGDAVTNRRVSTAIWRSADSYAETCKM